MNFTSYLIELSIATIGVLLAVSFGYYVLRRRVRRLLGFLIDEQKENLEQVGLLIEYLNEFFQKFDHYQTVTFGFTGVLISYEGKIQKNIHRLLNQSDQYLIVPSQVMRGIEMAYARVDDIALFRIGMRTSWVDGEGETADVSEEIKLDQKRKHIRETLDGIKSIAEDSVTLLNQSIDNVETWLTIDWSKRLSWLVTIARLPLGFILCYLVVTHEFTQFIYGLGLLIGYDVIDGQLIRILGRAPNSVIVFRHDIDVVIDRLIIQSVLLCFILIDLLPVWAYILIVVQELALIALGIVTYLRGITVRPVSMLSRLATFMLAVIAMSLFLGDLKILWLPMVIYSLLRATGSFIYLRRLINVKV